MTYCLGLLNRQGLVMMADTRTHSGVDHIHTNPKLFDFSSLGQRAVVLMASGNRAATQAVLAMVRRDLHLEITPNIHTHNTLHETANYIGDKLRLVEARDRIHLERDNFNFNPNFILGGQLPGQPPELFQIYTQGNHIQASYETPYLQLGESKYGKPILDRGYRYHAPLFTAAVKYAMLSMNSTVLSNASVGPPLDLVIYETDSFVLSHRHRLQADDPYLVKLQATWGEALRQTISCLPDFPRQTGSSNLGVYGSLEDDSVAEG
ncbi:peptidase [Candidatus Cyanaurora vandensis]|uniref:peptidase n=1 Tax=Candidatus Cyanaurora vandensis TaxID=2714958 RepID=UPI0025808AB8|nr:peptidase [Candidatus Cyanaurora vandensis]